MLLHDGCPFLGSYVAVLPAAHCQKTSRGRFPRWMAKPPTYITSGLPPPAPVVPARPSTSLFSLTLSRTAFPTRSVKVPFTIRFFEASYSEPTIRLLKHTSSLSLDCFHPFAQARSVLNSLFAQDAHPPGAEMMCLPQCHQHEFCARTS
jgi:hypothetical protein